MAIRRGRAPAAWTIGCLAAALLLLPAPAASGHGFDEEMPLPVVIPLMRKPSPVQRALPDDSLWGRLREDDGLGLRHLEPVDWAKRLSAVTFGAGLAFGVHEASHFLAGEAVGIRGHFDQATIRFPGARGQDGQIISTAGFMGQALTTEVVLGSHLERRSDIAFGTVLFNVANTLGYILRHETSDGGYGDIAFYLQSGGDKGLLYGLLLGHSALSLVRLWKDDIPFLPIMYTGKDRLQLGVQFAF